MIDVYSKTDFKEGLHPHLRLLICFSLNQNKGQIHFGWQRKRHAKRNTHCTNDDPVNAHAFNGFVKVMQIYT